MTIQYFALQVFNGIFGGFSHSKLFINVREKASLAYYAASRVESHKGLLMVMSGIDAKNYDQAVTIIKEQMQEMKQGSFTDGEIAQTKAVIHNQRKEVVFGLKEDGVGIAPSQDNVSKDALKAVDEYKQKILDGDITVPQTDKEFKEFEKTLKK